MTGGGSICTIMFSHNNYNFQPLLISLVIFAWCIYNNYHLTTTTPPPLENIHLLQLHPAGNLAALVEWSKRNLWHTHRRVHNYLSTLIFLNKSVHFEVLPTRLSQECSRRWEHINSVTSPHPRPTARLFFKAHWLPQQESCPGIKPSEKYVK